MTPEGTALGGSRLEDKVGNQKPQGCEESPVQGSCQHPEDQQHSERREEDRGHFSPQLRRLLRVGGSPPMPRASLR